MTLSPWRSAMSRIASQSGQLPARFSIRIAPVFSVTMASILVTSTVNVLGSMSTNTGQLPADLGPSTCHDTTSPPASATPVDQTRLAAWVAELLSQRWSPRQISRPSAGAIPRRSADVVVVVVVPREHLSSYQPARIAFAHRRAQPIRNQRARRAPDTHGSVAASTLRDGDSIQTALAARLELQRQRVVA